MFRHLGLWYEKRTNLQTQTTLNGLYSSAYLQQKSTFRSCLELLKALPIMVPQPMGGEGLEPPTTSV
jgi:hypothetical protein